MKTVRGTIRWGTDSDHPELWQDDCQCLSEIDISKQPSVPLEEELLLTLDGSKLLSWRREGPLASRNTTRKDIALFRLVQPSTTVDERDWEIIRKEARQLQDETRRWSRGLWEVHVTPYVYRPEEKVSTHLRGFHWNKFKRWLDDEYPDNNHNYWHMSIRITSSVCGVAWRGGTEAVSYCGINTIHHEQGHNFGLAHAGTPVREYLRGDEWMGTGGARDNHNAPMIQVLGLVDSQYVEKAEKDVTAYLVQHDTPDMAVREGEKKIIHLKNNGKDMKVSLLNGEVSVHQPADSWWGQTQLLDTIGVGGSRSINNYDITVVESYEDQSVKVVVGKGSPNKKPAPLPVGGVEPWNKSGLWHNPKQSAQGIYVYPLKDQNRIVLAWMYWSQQDYEQRWAISDMTVDANNVATGDLLITEDGETIVSGSASLIFNEDGSASFYARSEDTLRWGATLERVAAPASHPLTGWWDLGDRQGLFVQVVGDRLVAHWLTRDISNKPWDKGESPRWYEIQGPIGEELTVYEVKDGMLGVEAETSIQPIGSAYIETENATLLNKEHPMNKLA